VIFVSIGTSEPFDRLLSAVDGLGEGEELVVQYGTSSVRPAGATCVEFLDFEETLALMRRARVVITHAGVGSVLTALQAGRRPLLVPRLGRLGEAIDDHQLVFDRRVAENGLGVVLENLERLREAVDTIDPLIEGERLQARELAGDLRAYLESVVGSRRGSTSSSGRA
jgi:UDP-N-acetylglucosamine transferase subunit ALG13